MAPVSREHITRLLQAIGAGDELAWSTLLPLVYDELAVIARQRMGRLPPGATLLTTDLVHECYLRMLGRDATWENRRHFFGAVSRAMRDILVEEARRRSSQKRGGDWQRVELDGAPLGDDGRGVDLITLDEALVRLERDDPVQHSIVMLRYFGGLSVDETASALDISPSSVDRNWRFARAWLKRELDPS